MAEIFAALRRADFDAVLARKQRIHAAPDVHLAAMLFDIVRRALREQRGKADARQQHVAVRAGAVQRIAQHVEQHLCGSLVYRRVQCGDAQRFPELDRQVCSLAVLREQLGHRDVVGQTEIDTAQYQHEAHCVQPVGHRQSSGANKRGEQVQRGGQLRRLHRKLVVQLKLQRNAQEIGFAVAADFFDQAQGIAVAAEQQVLAVVELRIVV